MRGFVFLMIIVFGCFGYSEVVLVPKPGAKPQKKISQEYSAEAEPGGEVEPDVVLRKPKKERKVSSNNKKNKKKKKSVVPVESLPSDDMERIYQEEKQILESTELESDGRSVASEPTPLESLYAIERKYKNSGFVEIEVEKEVYQELLESTKNYKGVLYFDRERQFRLSIREPIKSEILVTNKNVYMIDYPVDEAQNKVQILRSAKPESLRAQGVLALLWGKKRMEELFIIQLKSRDGNEARFEFKSKKKKQSIQTFELTVNVSENVFKKISFSDEIGNRTTYYFKKHTLLEKSPKGIFDFKQPNNASITDI